MVDGVMIRTQIIIQLNNISIVPKVFKLQFLGYFYIYLSCLCVHAHVVVVGGCQG